MPYGIDLKFPAKQNTSKRKHLYFSYKIRYNIEMVWSNAFAADREKIDCCARVGVN